MNTGTKISMKLLKGSPFWKAISKDSRKHMLGIYDEYIRNQERKMKRGKSEDDEEDTEYEVK